MTQFAEYPSATPKCNNFRIKNSNIWWNEDNIISVNRLCVSDHRNRSQFREQTAIDWKMNGFSENLFYFFDRISWLSASFVFVVTSTETNIIILICSDRKMFLEYVW